MVTIPDPLAAVRAYLLGDPLINSLTSGRVYGAELPASVAGSMPQASAVIQYSGGTAIGPGARSYVKVGLYRIDVKAYGGTPHQAAQVHFVCHDRLKNQLKRSVELGDTLLHNAVVAGGPIDLRDGDLDWPLVLGVYEIMVGEVAVT